MGKIRVLDLFSGIGGFSLGLERTGGFETAAFCEVEPFCQSVLQKHWPDVPIYNDIKTIREEFKDGPVDLICGGYPCQPFSVAGSQRGEKDDRHLWPEMFECIREYRPRWIIGENVAGHIKLGLDTVLSDLESEGYTTRAFSIPACAINAPHKRERVWIVGNAEHNGSSTTKKSRGADTSGDHNQEGKEKASQPERASRSRGNEDVANGDTEGLQGGQETRDAESQGQGGDKLLARCSKRKPWENWTTEPNVGRMAHGIPDRVDRIKSLGNSLVPQIVEMIGYAILEVDNDKTV
jgi:DNA (cytosine-5)-methyltransferase 1